MNWLTRWRRLRTAGILGMNRRNAQCILDLNPRRDFPQVDTKSKMYRLCQDLGVPTPRLYALITAHSALRHLPRLLDGRADFVIKPDRGSGGRGVLVVVGREGNCFVRSNGERLTLGALHDHASSIVSGLYSLGALPDAAMLEQRVIPDPVFERVSYQGTPDVRVVLYKQVPVMAMLRLPTKLSDGRANLHQGAVGVGVDLATGVTTQAVLRDHITDRHPDTGLSVIGLEVPHWSQILEMARTVSRAVGLGYLGVDIVLDRTAGPLLLEGNARPGLAIQIANGQGLMKRLAEVDQQREANVGQAS
jgi:alpha-L-glutamate ligase-like protein